MHWEIQPFCCVGFIIMAMSMELNNFIWTLCEPGIRTAKQHLWMGSAAVQTLPGVPGQHRGTCLLSSRIHRGNSSGFHHCPLFYALYSTSQEIRGRYYFLTKISVIWLQLAASASLCTSNVGFGLMSPCQECVLYWHRVIWFLLHNGSASDRTAFTPPCEWGQSHFQGSGGALRAASRYILAAALGTLPTGKQMRAILHH